MISFFNADLLAINISTAFIGLRFNSVICDCAVTISITYDKEFVLRCLILDLKALKCVHLVVSVLYVSRTAVLNEIISCSTSQSKASPMLIC